MTLVGAVLKRALHSVVTVQCCALEWTESSSTSLFGFFCGSNEAPPIAHASDTLAILVNSLMITSFNLSAATKEKFVNPQMWKPMIC